MNREQRRAAGKTPPVTINHGHDGEHVVLVFSRPTPSIALTIEQADAFIKAVAHSKAKLLEHKASNG